jgi:hypothetical protein
MLYGSHVERAMPYKITFEPLNRIAGVKPTTVEIETAAEAWREVDGLMRSDERVKIVDPRGVEIGWQWLKEIAEKEDN